MGFLDPKHIMKISARGRFQEGLWNLNFYTWTTWTRHSKALEEFDSLGLGPGLYKSRERELSAGMHTSVLSALD